MAGRGAGAERVYEHAFSIARGRARATLRTLSDLGVFEVSSEKPPLNLPVSGVSDLQSVRLPPIMKKKIIFHSDEL